MQKPSFHKHPDSGVPVHGVLLKPGMRLRLTDLFAGGHGAWEPSPFPPGVILMTDNDGRWVRPIPEGVTTSVEYIPAHYFHPRTFRHIFGTLVLPCAVLRATDVYSSSSGEWEPCPCPGIVLECLVPGVYWIRPEDAP